MDPAKHNLCQTNRSLSWAEDDKKKNGKPGKNCWSVVFWEGVSGGAMSWWRIQTSQPTKKKRGQFNQRKGGSRSMEYHVKNKKKQKLVNIVRTRTHTMWRIFPLGLFVYFIISIFVTSFMIEDVVFHLIRQVERTRKEMKTINRTTKKRKKNSRLGFISR